MRKQCFHKIFIVLHKNSTLKSPRATILVSLCTVLFVAYITFLTGVDKTNNKVQSGLGDLRSLGSSFAFISHLQVTTLFSSGFFLNYNPTG